MVVVETLDVFENFCNVGVFDGFVVPATQCAVSFNGCNGGNDLDNCNKSWAASVSSFVRIL